MSPLDETVDALAALDVEGMDGFRAAACWSSCGGCGPLAAVEARLVDAGRPAPPVGRRRLPGSAVVAGDSDNTSLGDAHATSVWPGVCARCPLPLALSPRATSRPPTPGGSPR